MSDVHFVAEDAKKYQPYKEIREQYSGYVVCLVRCNAEKSGRIFGGEVLAYASSLSPLMRAAEEIIDDDSCGHVAYKSFVEFPDVFFSSFNIVEEIN
jgi:hypothetical protein